MKLGGKHDVLCLFVFRLIIHCFAATTAAVRQQFSMLNREIPLSRDVLPFPSCAVCDAELTKSCNRMHFLKQSVLFGFFVLFVFFLNLLAFAWSCSCCHSRRSRAPHSEAACHARGSHLFRNCGVPEPQAANTKSQWNWTHLPTEALVLQRVHSQSLINQSVPILSTVP